MSLINDALKKAQRERTNAPEHPTIGTPPSPPPPAGRGPASRSTLQARSNPWPALIVVLAVIGGGTAVWFLKPGGQSAPATTGTAAVAVQTSEPPAPPPVTATPLEPAPALVSLQINLPGPTETLATPVAAAPVPPAVATPPPQATAAVAQPVPPAQAASVTEPFKISLQLEDPRILAFLDAARIQGIRSVADDAKLLMYSKVFRAGTVVDRELGLKLVQILPNELVFEDARGIQYRKIL